MLVIDDEFCKLLRHTFWKSSNHPYLVSHLSSHLSFVVYGFPYWCWLNSTLFKKCNQEGLLTKISEEKGNQILSKFWNSAMVSSELEKTKRERWCLFFKDRRLRHPRRQQLPHLSSALRPPCNSLHCRWIYKLTSLARLTDSFLSWLLKLKLSFL